MMVKKPQYVCEYKDRHGVNRIYFRRKGHKGWPLRQPLRSPEFWEDYEAATRGEVPPGCGLKYKSNPEPQRPAKPNSFRWLIQEYKSSAAFRRLSLGTQKVRAGILDELSVSYGDFPYSQLDQRAVLKLRDQKAHVPEAANARVKAIRQVYKYALEYNIEGIETDPTRDVRLLHSDNPDGFHAWTAEEVEKFEQAHPIGTNARLALALMLYAGCARRSDVIVLGKQHLTKDGRLQYKQFKGRNKKPVHIDIPVISELRKIIDASPCGDLTFVVTKFGKPFTSNGFGNWFKKRCKEAGLPHCSAHGVRKAAAARLAELGCSDHEIMAIGGWQTLKEVQRYTKGARKRVLSDNAMDKVQADIDRTKVSNLSGDVN
jgi:integrase